MSGLEAYRAKHRADNASVAKAIEDIKSLPVTKLKRVHKLTRQLLVQKGAIKAPTEKQLAALKANRAAALVKAREVRKSKALANAPARRAKNRARGKEYRTRKKAEIERAYAGDDARRRAARESVKARVEAEKQKIQAGKAARHLNDVNTDIDELEYWYA